MTTTQVTSGMIATGVATITGEIRMWTTATPPTGWLLCDASAVSRTTYAALFAVISTTFGVGDGSTTFNLPDFRGRIPVGVGTGDASDATAFALADKDGTETHALVEAELAAHTHDFSQQTNSGVSSVGGGSLANFNDTLDDPTTSTGSGTAHNNLQPSLGIHFIIKT